jgi:CubicO group peptidase (beta-lactamase class C family)
MPTLPLGYAARLTAATALLVVVAGTSLAQTIPSDSAIRSILKERVDSGRAPGIVVGILEHGQRRYIAYGSAGPGRPPLNEHTIFEIGSISKTFTSLLLADAVTRGEVRLDEPVADLLPAGTTVPSRDGKVITLELLATHRSGLPRLPTNLVPADPADPYADYTAPRLYAFLATYQLPRAPGDSAEYSNLGVGLLGHALVRRAGASSWGALVAQRIAGPLGMRETFVDVPADARARVAAGHDASMDTVPAWHFDALAGAGALRSSAADLLTYLAAELDTVSTSGPLGRAMARARTPRADFGGGNRIALAWLIQGSTNPPFWWHNGETGGFTSFVAFDPARQVAVVVLANAGVQVDDIGAHLIDPSVPLHMPPIPVHRTVVSLPVAALERVVGDYPLAPTFVLQVSRIGDALYLQATGQQKVRLWPEAPDRFFIKEVDAQLTFTFNGNGSATSVTLRQNGASQTAPRKP